MHNYPTLVDALKAQGIHSLLPQFTDIHGVAKGKLVPVENLREWVEVGAGFAGPSIWGTGLPHYGARKELGWTLWVGIEQEYFLLNKRDGQC